MNPGDSVRVLPPFDSVFDEVYIVGSVDAENATAFLDGVPEDYANAFAFSGLEVANG